MQICAGCGLLAAQTLSHLLKNEQHSSIIARDDTVVIAQSLNNQSLYSAGENQIHHH